MINIFDNFFSGEDAKFIHNYCKNSLYKYGEVDDDGLPPVGMICQLFQHDDLYGLLEKHVNNHISCIKNLNLHRMYINCFSPRENPYFHTDSSSGVTCIYYPNLSWEQNDGGETQFLIDNELYGVLPIPNRLLCFDGSLLHKATSFRNDHRFTVVAKYE